MLLRRLATLALVAAPVFALAQTAATYSLTPASADKFVRATQGMVQAGVSPHAQQGGGNPLDLSGVQRQIEASPGAKQALATAGMSSAEYVAFMGAAMAAMMVGQMESAGMRGMLPPGITTRPAQGNIDFMKSNTDIFQRAMTPGAPTAAGSGQPLAAANTADDAKPMPADAGAVLPSSLLARLPRLDTINKGTDCSVGNIQRTIETETAKARALQTANYGNPGDYGLARTPAEGAVLERAEDPELELCSANLLMQQPASFAAAAEERSRAQSRIVQEQQTAWSACPGIAGGKDPACERRVEADAARKLAEAERRYLTTMAQPFADRTSALQTCIVKREALVKDAKTANVRGANIQAVLRPLVVSWENLPLVTSHWTSICDEAKRVLQ
jgi:hypothetical protein